MTLQQQAVVGGPLPFFNHTLIFILRKNHEARIKLSKEKMEMTSHDTSHNRILCQASPYRCLYVSPTLSSIFSSSTLFCCLLFTSSLLFIQPCPQHSRYYNSATFQSDLHELTSNKFWHRNTQNVSNVGVGSSLCLIMVWHRTKASLCRYARHTSSIHKIIYTNHPSATIYTQSKFIEGITLWIISLQQVEICLPFVANDFAASEAADWDNHLWMWWCTYCTQLSMVSNRKKK